MKRLRSTVLRLLWPAVLLAPLSVGFGQTTSTDSSRHAPTPICDNDGGEIHCSASRPATAGVSAPPRPAALLAPVLTDPEKALVPPKAHRQLLSSAVCESDDEGEIHCSGDHLASPRVPPVQRRAATVTPPAAASALAASAGSASRQVASPVCDNDAGEIHCSAGGHVATGLPASPWPAATNPPSSNAPGNNLATAKVSRPVRSSICENESGEIHCSKEASSTPPASANASAAPGAAPAQSATLKALISPQGGNVTSVSSLAPSNPNSPPSPHEVMLAVRINGRPASEFAQVIQQGDSHFYVSPDLLRQWRLNSARADAWSIGDQTVYRLDELPGVKTNLNSGEQVLSLNATAAAFTATALDASTRPQAVEAMHSSPGLFLNHQLQYTYADQKSVEAGLFEAGFFSQLGVLTSRFSDSNFETSTPLRLDTQLTREYPERMAALTVGDALSSNGPWARQINYAGVRWASDFSTQPNFVPVVMPSLAGSAAEPSTVDIYVNGLRTYRQQVDAGPFAIQNVPVITGEGQVQMVVTDVLGRQQVITQSYLNTPQLLRPAVNEYTYEAGSMRRNFGTASDDYGSPFFAGSERHGFSKILTLDGRAEVTTQQQTLGAGADVGWFPLGVISGELAVSHSDLGPGGLFYVSFQHSARSLGYSGTIQVASSTFQQLGMIADERAAKLQAQFQVTHAMGRRGSISVGYLRQENRPYLDNVQPMKQDFSGISTSFSYRMGSRMYLTVGTNLSNSFANASSANVTLLVPLGPRNMMLTTSNVQQDGTQSSTVEYMKQLPVGNGLGYTVKTNITDQASTDVDLSAQTNNGKYELESTQQASGISSRFTETGSLVLLHDRILPSQWLNNSFAVVEVPGTPGVKVYTNNQYIASTSYRGLAVVPSLVPYNRNTIRLDDDGVPVNLGMDFTDKTVVPMSRSGVFLTFAATPAMGALFQLVTENGTPLPLDTEVTINANSTIYTVALRGEVFVSEVSFPAHLHARWGNQQCEAVVKAGPENKPLPRIGPVTCKVRL